MQLITKNIIKLLPFEESFKRELLEKYDSLSDDARFEIEQITWSGYADFYEIMLEGNLALALQKAKQTNEPLTEDFYKRVEEDTEKQMEQELTKDVENVDLSAARQKLEEILRKSTN